MKTISIGNYKIGADYPALIVAELSANHARRFEIAVRTIKAMKKAGANAVKFQTYTPDTMTINSRNDLFRIKHKTPWDGKTLYQLYKSAYTPWKWQPRLKRIAEDLGLLCFSSPFDKTSVDFLEKLNVPAYKIASYEITDIPLIEYIASKNKPVMISTGIATLQDIREAVRACKKMGNNRIILLKCTSEYPSSPENINLMAIPHLSRKFDTIIGLSDHTLTSFIPAVAVALGAKIIEKHFIMDKKLGGPDAAFSLDRQEFEVMVRAVRATEAAMGEAFYKLSKKAEEGKVFARSLFAVKSIKKDEILTDENIRSIRPGYGLHPKYLKKVIGRNAKKDIGRGMPLKWDMVR